MLKFQAPAWFPVWQRNFLVWRKLLIPSLIGNFGEPLLYLLALGFGLGRMVGSISGIPYIAFLASGIVCSSAMTTATFEGLYSAYTRMTTQQTWDGILATPLGIKDIVAGEAAYCATKSLINSTAILVIATILGLVPSWNAIWVVPVIFIMGYCFGSMALVITAIAQGYDFFLYYFSLFITPVMLLSGVYFPLANLPYGIQLGVKLLPLYHAVVLVRPLMLNQPLQQPWLHLLVLLIYGFFAYVIAARLIAKRLIV